VEIGGLILLVPGVSWKKAEPSTGYGGPYQRDKSWSSSGTSSIVQVNSKVLNFSTEPAHPKLRNWVQAISVSSQVCGGLVVTNKCIVLLCCALAIVPAFGAQRVAMRTRPAVDAADQELIREIVDLERQAKEASLRRDAEFSQRSLADDYVAITPLGQVTTKQETIGARRSGQLRYEAMNITDMVVRVYGDTAVVTARADVKGHQLGEDFSGPYRYTRVWVRRSGRWQTVSYQATVTQ
jgi:ketosteroid isomerase-like protein